MESLIRPSVVPIAILLISPSACPHVPSSAGPFVSPIVILIIVTILGGSAIIAAVRLLFLILFFLLVLLFLSTPPAPFLSAAG